MSDTIAQRIEIFNEVRDLPYQFDLADPSKDRSCRGKAGLLVEKLQAIGIKAQPICCHFSWSDTVLPKELVEHSKLGESEHWFVRAEIPEVGEAVDIDPTWDSALSAAGFPIAVWDGIHPTALALRPFDVLSAEDSLHLWRNYQALPPTVHRNLARISGKFYGLVNQWFDSQRQRGPHA